MPRPPVALLAAAGGHAGDPGARGERGSPKGLRTAGDAPRERRAPSTTQDSPGDAAGKGRGSWTPGYENRLVAFCGAPVLGD